MMFDLDCLTLTIFCSSVILQFPDVFSAPRQIKMDFISDATEGRRGFYLEYFQELCLPDNRPAGISYSVGPSPVGVVGEVKNPSQGSFEYPTNNYVARAQLEQIVETQVRVVDSKDGLSHVAGQVSNLNNSASSNQRQSNSNATSTIHVN